jgi:phosphomethylpyrimidine synthase
MKITQDLRAESREMLAAEQAIVEKGLAEKSAEFLEKGAKLYLES